MNWLKISDFSVGTSDTLSNSTLQSFSSRRRHKSFPDLLKHLNHWFLININSNLESEPISNSDPSSYHPFFVNGGKRGVKARDLEFNVEIGGIQNLISVIPPSFGSVLSIFSLSPPTKSLLRR